MTTRRRSNSLAVSKRLPMLACAVLCGWGGGLGLADQAAAQSSAVVQPLPPPEANELNDALRRIARNSRDVEALADAGTASLKLGDVDAATGFFQRASSLAPSNARVKAGLASTLVRTEQPLRALELFAEAERLGRVPADFAPDQGLAYDLVGDNLRAQTHYVRALRADPDDETRRRLALSQAISGDRRGFETSLIPLLRKRDVASYRVRAFGLAILGDVDEAIAITEAAMSGELATRLAPYLRYMPTLTRAQQAAAANLGVFPQAASIGRDDPRIADFSGNASAGAAQARLAPTGAPMGSRTREDSTSQRRRPGSSGGGRSATASDTRRVTEREARRIARREANDPLSRTAVRRTRVVEPEQAASPAPVPPPPPPPPPAAQEPNQSAATSTERPIAAVDQAASDSTESEAETVASIPRPSISVASQTDENAAEQTFDLGQLSRPAAAEVDEPEAVTISRAPPPPPPPLPPAATQSLPASMEDAFSDFTMPASGSSSPGAGAVDIASIEPPREIEESPEAEPEHPRRIWVQIATGRDRSALRFDWRRFARQAPDVLEGKGPFVVAWGEANRLLAGPFADSRIARSVVNDLAEEGIDSFAYTSPEGQEIEQLQ